MKYKDYIKLGLVGLATVTALCVGGCSNGYEPKDGGDNVYNIVEPAEMPTEAPVSVSDDEVAVVPTESTETAQEGTGEATEGAYEDMSDLADEETASLLAVSVVRVVDGDTYYVNMDGQDVKVRLIGIDTPESVAPQSYTDATGKENTEVGEYISEIMKDVIKEGDTLLLEFDVDMYDKYDRVLAYAYFDDGEMVQDFLLSNGLAQVMTIQPNVKYSDHFAEMQRVAVENGIGIWNYDIATITKEDLMPTTRVPQERVTDCGWNK